MDVLGRLFVDPTGEATLTHTFTAYTGEEWNPTEGRRLARREVMTDALHSELARLTELAVRACATSPACRDYTRTEIEDVLAEILAHYPVYRTYLGAPRSVETTVRVKRISNDVAVSRAPSKSKLEEFAESRRATDKVVALEREEAHRWAQEHSRPEPPPETRSEETTAPMRPWRENTPSAPLAVAPAPAPADEPHADLFGAIPEPPTEKRRSRDRMRVVDILDPAHAHGTPPDGMPALPRAHTRIGDARAPSSEQGDAPRTSPGADSRARSSEDDRATRAMRPPRGSGSAAVPFEVPARGTRDALEPRTRTDLELAAKYASTATAEPRTRTGDALEPRPRTSDELASRTRTGDERILAGDGLASPTRTGDALLVGRARTEDQPSARGVAGDELASRTRTGGTPLAGRARTDVEPSASGSGTNLEPSRTRTSDASPYEIDRARIAEAVAGAKRARADLDPDLLAFLEAALAFELPSPEAQELAQVAQQSTGPIVAKGDEDTLSYRAVRLLARCEVGADIADLAIAPKDAHAYLAQRGARDMNATSTHDTKRGEDVRARIAVLSEIPAVWDAAVASWGERAAAGWGNVERDRPFELAMWQTLVGAWPLSVERAQRWAEKATREARSRTSWRKPDERYESARRAWIDRIYGDRALSSEIEQLVARIAPHGDRNSLAMLLVKLCAPGVPDFYQGSELRVATLVDPDNRDRYEPREPASDLDRDKLHVTRSVLALRRRDPALFEGAYRALVASGPEANRVFAFARGEDLVAVVPRLGVGASWADTTLALDGDWTDVLSERTYTGGAHPLAEIWSRRSVALLVRSRT